MGATLLVELLTEELPPKSLATLGVAFTQALCEGLVLHRLLHEPTNPQKILATPRRLAAIIPGVLEKANDRPSEVAGPSIKAPAEAVAGFAKKHGLDAKALDQRDTPKGQVFVARITFKSASPGTGLSEIVNDSIKKLPIAKLMRLGAGDEQFVRPVHGLVMLHGARVVPGAVLGMTSGNRTAGHRFMGKQDIRLANAGHYEATLRDEGLVIADFAVRRAEVDRQLKAEAQRQHADLGRYADLLDEVTALVEHPS